MIRAFSRRATWFIAAAIALTIYLTLAWAPAMPLLMQVALSEITLAERVMLVSQALVSSAFDFARFSGIALIIPFLIGINASLWLFAWRMARASAGAGSGSLLASAAGLFGVGCAACGAGFAAPLAALIGAGALQTIFTENFTYLGIALLVLSTWLLTRAIAKPAVCPL